MDTEDAWPGQSWGLPETGPGSVASAPRRLGQFLLDLLIGGAVASAFAFPAPPTLSLVVWAVLVTVPVALIGQTPAMVITGMRVARILLMMSFALDFAAIWSSEDCLAGKAERILEEALTSMAVGAFLRAKSCSLRAE